MLQATVQQLGDTTVLRCRGQIVIGEAYGILNNTAMSQTHMSQTHVKLLVLDLAQVDRVDAGGLGILLGLQEWARANAIRFKLMNVMNRVEQVFELTRLDRVFEFSSVQDLLCLLHRAAVMSSCRFEGSNPAHRSEFMATQQGAPASREKESLLGLRAWPGSSTIQTNKDGVSNPSFFVRRIYRSGSS
jgi:anti-anti-sigma factor